MFFGELEYDFGGSVAFTSFFEAEGSLDFIGCSIPWTGSLSSDGSTFNGTSDEVDCYGAFGFDTITSFTFSADRAGK
jgi:hypothetical protein